MIFLFATVAVIIIISFYAVTIYNSLVNIKNQVSKAWANIDVVLKQRFDEIPQLIEVINQYVQHEKNIITQLTNARTLYGKANSPNEKIKASSELSLALQGIMSIGENYPELKSNTNFMQLQTRISELEEMLTHRREFYNEAVNIFNTRIEQLPDVFVARMLNYTPKVYFEVASSEKIRPNLKINV